MAVLLNASDPGFDKAFADLVEKNRAEKSDVDSTVAAILADVRTRGDAALIEYTQRFDRVTLTPKTLAFLKSEIGAGAAASNIPLVNAIDTAAARIREYHHKQMPSDELYTDSTGVKLGWRWTAVASAGLYVPGGTAALFSSVLMNAIPAKVAGVKRLVVVMPTPEGRTNPAMLAACAIAGVDEVYRVGGAQAVGALAYGTETIKPVDKIVGPGNAYVASAKRQVFGRVGIDMVAGPSEVTVVADAKNDPDWIAADLMAQAEHDTSAQSVLITDSADFAKRVMEAVDTLLKTLPRASIAAKSWQDNGAIIVVRTLSDAPELVNRMAPEHVQLAVEYPGALQPDIRHAGAIFMGRHTPEALGDYIAGPSHVLPTSGTARYASGLGVFDFIKRTSIIDASVDSLSAIGPGAVAMAEAEGLAAHARSVALRVKGARA